MILESEDEPQIWLTLHIDLSVEVWSFILYYTFLFYFLNEIARSRLKSSLVLWVTLFASISSRWPGKYSSNVECDFINWKSFGTFFFFLINPFVKRDCYTGTYGYIYQMHGQKYFLQLYYVTKTWMNSTTWHITSLWAYILVSLMVCACDHVHQCHCSGRVERIEFDMVLGQFVF